MVLTTAADRGRWAVRFRLVVLALVALLAAHSAVYAASYGIGPTYAGAMARDGHDGWWLPASAAILVAGFALLIRILGGVTVLELRARQSPAGPATPGTTFAAEARSLWLRLFPLVALVFTVQENVERIVAHGEVLGLVALGGSALPILAFVTLGLSLLGALVRWRVAVLRARIARRLARARRRITADTVASRWRTIATLAPSRWMAARLDAGRAPPRFLAA